MSRSPVGGVTVGQLMKLSAKDGGFTTRYRSSNAPRHCTDGRRGKGLVNAWHENLRPATYVALQHLFSTEFVDNKAATTFSLLDEEDFLSQAIFMLGISVFGKCWHRIDGVGKPHGIQQFGRPITDLQHQGARAAIALFHAVLALFVGEATRARHQSQ